jgi:hypothetical protein
MDPFYECIKLSKHLVRRAACAYVIVASIKYDHSGAIRDDDTMSKARYLPELGSSDTSVQHIVRREILSQALPVFDR